MKLVFFAYPIFSNFVRIQAFVTIKQTGGCQKSFKYVRTYIIKPINLGYNELHGKVHHAFCFKRYNTHIWYYS